MPIPLYQAKAELFRTLGHPARIRILELLSARPHAVHELLDHVEIEASNLSQQLGVLRRTGLVMSTRASGEVTYSIAIPEVADLLLAGRRILGNLAEAHAILDLELRNPEAPSTQPTGLPAGPAADRPVDGSAGDKSAVELDAADRTVGRRP